MLRLEWITNSVYSLERVEVTETPSSVRIGIVERAPNGLVTLEGVDRRKRVRLRSPLGGRRVVDARTGRPIPALVLRAAG